MENVNHKQRHPSKSFLRTSQYRPGKSQCEQDRSKDLWVCEIDFRERKLRDRVNALQMYCVENMKDTQTGFSRDKANFITFCYSVKE